MGRRLIKWRRRPNMAIALDFDLQQQINQTKCLLAILLIDIRMFAANEKVLKLYSNHSLLIQKYKISIGQCAFFSSYRPVNETYKHDILKLEKN